MDALMGALARILESAATSGSAAALAVAVTMAAGALVVVLYRDGRADMAQRLDHTHQLRELQARTGEQTEILKSISEDLRDLLSRRRS